jgi:PEP-CTERM motif-containing protein
MRTLETIVKRRLLLAGMVASAVALVGVKAYADDASDIEQFYPNNSYVTWDNTAGPGPGTTDPSGYPVITAIGSQPGTFGGHTYTGWSVLAQDNSGSMDLFISQASLTNTVIGGPSTLATGEGVSVAGQWGPFHQIPEVAFSAVAASNNYFHVVSSGNGTPALPVFTVSQLSFGNVVNPTLTTNIAGYYLQINDVTISSPSNGLTALPGYTTVISNETFTVTDNTGSMTMFDWVTSYSSAEMLTGTAIGVSNQYNIEGFVSVNTGGPAEFTPLALQAVPEPSTVMLVGAGLFGLLAIRRRRS